MSKRQFNKMRETLIGRVSADIMATIGQWLIEDLGNEQHAIAHAWGLAEERIDSL